MSNCEIIACRDPATLAGAVARDWLAELAVAARTAAHPLVALSGGRIARQLFEAAASLAQTQKVDFGAVHFFWSDERCVPPEDAESNFGLAHRQFLGPLSVKAPSIHRIRGELPGGEAAALAEAEVRRYAAADASGQPVLDLVFLGMGEDGHVASLFAVEPERVAGSPAVYRPVVGPKPPACRVTLGYRALQAARQVWVLASGPGKEAALERSLAGGALTPLGRVLASRTLTRVYTDIPLAEVAAVVDSAMPKKIL